MTHYLSYGYCDIVLYEAIFFAVIRDTQNALYRRSLFCRAGGDGWGAEGGVKHPFGLKRQCCAFSK